MNERCNNLETQVKNLTNQLAETNDGCIRANARAINFGLRLNKTNRVMVMARDRLVRAENIMIN